MTAFPTDTIATLRIEIKYIAQSLEITPHSACILCPPAVSLDRDLAAHRVFLSRCNSLIRSTMVALH
jgi:hypothetical protein